MNSLELEEQRKAVQEAFQKGSTKTNGVHVVQMWTGGNWMVRRDGKCIPEIGPVVDFLKERQFTVVYENGPNTFPVQGHEAYGHRLLEETHGAVCPEEVFEKLLHIEIKKIADTYQNKLEVIEIERRQAEREKVMRAKNPKGEAWDADQPNREPVVKTEKQPRRRA